jgi:lysyl-tRNA synthetase class 2
VTRVVLSPSDLKSSRPRQRVSVGGRVSFVDQKRIGLGDAFESLVAIVRQPSGVSPGDLLVLEGRWSRQKRLEDAKIVERTPCPLPRGDGEISRFSYQGSGRAVRARARALRAIREWFEAERFLEVDTPARVRTPGLDLHVDALPQAGGHLVTSPEFFMKRMLAGGFPRIYQLAHCFRADEQGAQHEPEFMMLEWYRAFADVERVMADTEQIVRCVFETIGKRLASKRPFERLPVREAFRRFANEPDAASLAKRNSDRYFELLVDRVEPALDALERPIFLVDYPISEASLARPSPADPEVAERFELYLSGVELCNGFGELTDPAEQRRRFQEDRRQRKRLGRPDYSLDERFLSALDEGMPRASGNALGVDRLIALALGATSIQDVMAFPEAWR